MEVQEKSSIVTLTLSAELPNTSQDPQNSISMEVEIQENSSSPWEPLGKTDLLPSNSSPYLWPTKFPICYKFQSQQLLKFSIHELISGEKLLYTSQIVEVCRVLNPVNYITLFQNSSLCGVLSAACEEYLESKKKLYMVFGGMNLADLDVFSKSDPYLKIYKQHGKAWSLIYESKMVPDNLNPEWEPIAMDYSHFCDCNASTRVRFDCFDYDSDTSSELIGICEMSAGEIHQGREYPFVNPHELTNGKPKLTGYLTVKKFELVEEDSFIDYLRKGMNINLSIAIDYTTSNGLYTDRSSLHCIQSGVLNEYEQAIDVFGTILSGYDSDKRYAVFGFGGIPNWLGGKVSHSFALNKSPENPFIEGYDAVRRCYRETLCEIELSGPTHLSGILRDVIEIIRRSEEKLYHILLVLTDGDLHDYQETVDLIVAASSLPLSVLIVGIGYENFFQLKKLDGDKRQLVDSQGRKCERDVVQFLPFRKYRENLSELAREALMEIPTQLMTYMKMNSIEEYL